jgi:hypothetical protein
MALACNRSMAQAKITAEAGAISRKENRVASNLQELSITI